MRSEGEIEEELNGIDPDAAAGGPSKYPGMSYEQGIDIALRWVLGWSEEAPNE